MAQVERLIEYPDMEDDGSGEHEALTSHYWHLKDNNGEIIAQGEGHTTPEAMQRAVNNVAREFAILYMNAADDAHKDVAALDSFEDWPVIDIPIVDVER